MAEYFRDNGKHAVTGSDLFDREEWRREEVAELAIITHIYMYTYIRYCILYYITLYYIVVCYVMLYHIILYYIVLYHIISFFIILYYIVLYYILLYYIILYISFQTGTVQYSVNSVIGLTEAYRDHAWYWGDFLWWPVKAGSRLPLLGCFVLKYVTVCVTSRRNFFAGPAGFQM